MLDRALVRVLVADDHPAMRRALAQVVREHASLELVGEAADGQAALDLIAAEGPDVALVDIRMPAVDGLRVVRRVVTERSPVKIVLISGHEDAAIVHEAISSGAAGVLSKLAEEDEISAAILDAAHGRSVLSPSLQAGLLDEIRARAPGRLVLSGRERELVELAADGVTNGEIAERLSLSQNTVKTYWQRLYDKLNVSDRASAVAEAIRQGLVE